jgi:hypothetical protein
VDGGGDVPSTLEVICHQDGTTTLSEDAVVVKRDGVHFSVDNRAGEGASMIGLVNDVPEGKSDNVSVVGPGSIRVACWPFSRHSGNRKDTPKGDPVEILDPQEVWVDPELECPAENDLAESAILDFVDTSNSDYRDPVAATEAFFKNLESDDVVELAGYPDAEPPSTRVVRDGDVVANVSFLHADDGGVLVEGYGSCAASGLKT